MTLRLLVGLSTAEIARAFLQPEPPQRNALCGPSAPWPEAGRVRGAGKAELRERLEAVLEVLYLVFNEGYAATSGEEWMRPTLCEEALRLGRCWWDAAAETEALGLLP